MRAGSRIDPEEFAALELDVHAFLGDVPLHDVWRLDLPAPLDGSSRSLADLRRLMALEDVAAGNSAVRALFRLRSWLGRVLRLDRAPRTGAPTLSPTSYIHRLSETQRAQSTEEPGTMEGPFQLVYTTEKETLSEIINSTVHAFSFMTLRQTADGYVAYWAIYVTPVGAITRFYMALIDPFRYLVVYPAILRHVHRRWHEELG